jgi:hypothetical protein
MARPRLRVEAKPERKKNETEVQESRYKHG